MIGRSLKAVLKPIRCGNKSLVRKPSFQRRYCQAGPEHVEGFSPVFLEYDPSPLHLIHTMLEKANLQPNESFLDFGCGDGRWVIEAAKCYGAQAYGIEIVPYWVNKARAEIEKENLTDKAQILQVNGFETDLSFADVVSLYFTKEGMEVMIPKLEKELKPGSRVISVKLPINEWEPDFQQRMYEYKVYMYTMPPKKRQVNKNNQKL